MQVVIGHILSTIKHILKRLYPIPIMKQNVENYITRVWIKINKQMFPCFIGMFELSRTKRESSNHLDSMQKSTSLQTLLRLLTTTKPNIIFLGLMTQNSTKNSKILWQNKEKLSHYNY